jgi:hypothetical protein
MVKPVCIGGLCGPSDRKVGGDGSRMTHLLGKPREPVQLLTFDQ